MLKLNKYIGKNSVEKTLPNGRISIENNSDVVNEVPLAERTRTLSSRKTDNDASNSEWQRMFATNPEKTSSSSSPMTDYHSSGSAHVNDTPSTSLVEYSMPEKNFIQGKSFRPSSSYVTILTNRLHAERTSDCKKELNSLQTNLKREYLILKSTTDLAMTKRASVIPSNGGIKGTLIAHVHEHKSSVTRLAALRSNSSLFASASTDGTVRLFDCNKLNGHQCINK